MSTAAGTSAGHRPCARNAAITAAAARERKARCVIEPESRTSASDSRWPRAWASASFTYGAAGLVDELWLHVAPLTVGAGEQLFRGVPPLDLELVESRGTDLSAHLRYHVRR